MSKRLRTVRAARMLLAVIWLLGAGSVWGVEPSSELHRLRAERRAKTRAHNLQADKAAAPGRFGLLVIPVDFSDARLPADWDQRQLSERLEPLAGETLANYFRIASAGRLDLDITVAPVVHLADTRRLYSDRNLNGFTRTRRLASESLSARSRR